ncbi:MAG: ABC transporter permease, partial [Dehalococcoidales bacterium]|nr:ABC transporter permease [Dehalococcoidales bacterium]
MMMRNIIHQYGLMLKWQALSQKPILPLNMAVQIMIAIGFGIGLRFFYPDINSTTAKYLTTGAPTIILLMIGLVLLPQIVGMARKEGTFDYIWSLPIPRMVYIAADATIWVAVALPGVIVALAMGAAYFDFSLSISLLVVPALLLVAISGVLLGYTIAFGAPKPEMAHILTQILVFAIMIFSPVLYPVEQLPRWLAKVHSVLPIQYMADLSRGTLTDLDVNLGKAFIVVGAWCLVGLI